MIPVNDVPLTPEQEEENAIWEAGAHDRAIAEVSLQRHAAYAAPNGSDAIFMKYQRDEATKEEWLAAKAAIDEALPYPVAPKTKKAKA